ncbi:MAG: cyclic nucleotide-binding domain-containing protein [Alphaproteobacteria bacterium]|nr:MAG: cyclic nucleotide-binding domain-containing protein [Alphaproteobacteria bacterium]
MSTQLNIKIFPRGGLCDTCKVRDVAVCAVQNDEELSRLEAVSTNKRFEPGQTIFHEGETPTHIFNLTEGTIRLVKLLPNGRRQIVGFTFPGDMMGLAAHGEYTTSAEAVTPIKICQFPRNKLLQSLEEFPSMKTRLLNIAADELSVAQDQMLLLGRKSPVEKVASFLARLCRGNSRAGGAENEVHLDMGRSDIADYLGLTIETVSRTFTKLRTEGVITLEGKHHVIINDMDALDDIAEEV